LSACDCAPVAHEAAETGGLAITLKPHSGVVDVSDTELSDWNQEVAWKW